MESLDLIRYLEEAEENIRLYSINELINRRINSGRNDFLYQVLLMIAGKLYIPLTLVTAVTVFSFYMMVIKVMRVLYKGKIENAVFVAILLITPITWVCAISRNLMAFLFLYIAVYFLIKNKWFGVLFFTALAVITHFAVLMFVAVLLFAYLLRKVRLSPYIIIVSSVVVLFASYLVPSSMINLMQFVLSDESAYYQYSELQLVSIFSSGGFAYGDLLPVLFALAFSFVLLLFNEKQGFAFWVLLLSTIMLVFFINIATHFVIRFCCFMPLFWGINVVEVYEGANKTQKSIVYLLSCMSYLPILLHFYSYRETYFIL